MPRKRKQGRQKKCEGCGDSFALSRGRPPKLCPKCRDGAREQLRRDRLKKACEYCGREFESSRKWSRFCPGNQCRNAYWNERAKEAKSGKTTA